MEVENAQSASWPTRTREYIDDVQAEMKRVSWPSWPQVRSTTLVVIVATFLLAGYFFVVDTIFNALINRLISAFTAK
jgi:preprotein translocase subunit SecE